MMPLFANSEPLCNHVKILTLMQANGSFCFEGGRRGNLIGKDYVISNTLLKKNHLPGEISLGNSC